MPTKSFTRNIEVTESAAIRKIRSAMKSNGIQRLRPQIKDIDTIKNHTRNKIASTLTHRY